MANEPGGTKFAQLIVEIDADRSKQDKAMDESVAAANLACIKIEKAFKQLGLRTDESYNQQRIAITTFYKKIINDANASANERAAAEQMLARKIEAINNRQYSALNSMRQAQVKAEEDAVKQRDQLWTNMGVRSNAQIEAQKKQVMDSYNILRSNTQGHHSELVRLEYAKNEKIRRLDDEMFGRKSLSWASLTRDVLRAYAAYYVLSQAIQYIAVPFEKGFKAVETFNTSIASMSAMVVSFSERTKGMSLADQWQQSLTYSKQLIPVLENIAAKTLLSGEETTTLANAFARSGVFINANNAAQIEGFTRISNALPLMTQGQEIMRQINTEIRGLMTGQNEQSSMMLITLKAIDPEIENHLRIWRAQGTVMENVGKLLEGFGPATSILENQWQAVKSTIDTTATQILRGAMKPAYEEIIELTKTLNKYLIENKDNINEWSKGVQERFQMIKGIVETITPVVKIIMGSPYRPASEPTWIDPHSVRPAIIPKPGPLQPTKEEIEKEKKLYEERKRNSEQAAELIAKLYDQANKETEENLKWFEKMEKEKLEISKKAGDAAVSQYNQIINLEKKQLDEREKNSDTYKKMWADEADFGITENERAINKIISDYDMKVLKLNELQESKESIPYKQYMDLKQRYTENKEKAIAETKYKALQDQMKYLGDLEGTETRTYDLRMLQIDKEIKEMKSLGVDEATARRYAANESDKAFIKMTRGSENFFQGTRAAFITLQEDAIRWGQVGTAVGNTFKTSLGTVMGDAIYQIIKGGFNEDSLKLYAAQVGDNVLKSFTNKIGEMGSQWVTSALWPSDSQWNIIWEGSWQLLKDGYQATLDWISSFNLIDTIGAAWSALANFISQLFMGTDGVGGLWDTISGFFQGQGREGVWEMPWLGSQLGNQFSATYGPDGFGFVAHQGEMIIPKEESDAIREWLEQNGFGSGFGALMDALGTDETKAAFWEGTTKSWIKSMFGLGAGSLMSGNMGNMLSALSPAMIFPAMFGGGFRNVATDIFGIDPLTANAGQFLGMGASSLLGLGTLGSAILIPIALAGMEGLMDWTGFRNDEENKDILESIYGEISGRVAYGKYLQDSTDQLEIVSQAAYAYKEDPWARNFDAAYALYNSAVESWPIYQASMDYQRQGMQARADFFKNTDAGKFIYGYYYRPELRDNFTSAQWEQMISEGMGQYGMMYQNPIGWKPEFTFPQYVSASTDDFLASQDSDYTAFYGQDPTFTVDPSTWLFDGSPGGMHQIPPYISSADYWASVLPPNYYGTGNMPVIIVDPGEYYDPGYGDLGGMRTGGVASGPISGYPMTLHGTEAVVPLPNGRSIPVDMGNSNKPIHIHLEMNGKEVAYAVANELDTNPRLKARYN